MNDHGCARLAAIHRTEEDLQEMERILQLAEKDITNVEQFTQHDINFHIALAKASHNRLAICVNNAIVGLNTQVMEEAIRDYSLEEKIELNRLVYESHYAIYEAIRAGDPIAADQCVDVMVSIFRAQFKEQDK